MPDVAPIDPPPAPPRSGAAHTRLFVLTFCALAVVWGVRHVWWWQPSPLDWLLKLAGCAALAWWALADARRRGHRIPMLARPWFLLFAGLVVLVYAVWSRGWRGAGWVLVLAAVWYGLATAAMHVGVVIVFGDEWIRAASAPERRSVWGR